MSSMMTLHVIILVRLAICLYSLSFFAKRVSPVDLSRMTQEEALMKGAGDSNISFRFI